MERGGLHHDRERVFLLSTTHGGETHGLAAARATLQTYQSHGVIEHLYRQGERLARGLQRSIACHRLSGHFELGGRPCNLVYATKDEAGNRSQAFRTLFLEQLLRQGVIAPSLVVSFSHSDQDIDRTVEAIDQALCVYRRALDEGIEKYLSGRPVRPVNRRFN
jgi:glutamate-1-semialdehyde 2,1-aminomutase